MPKSIPSVGDTNWGSPLNEHLAQLSDPSTGGINIWDDINSRPWTDGDNTRGDFDGYTGVNKSTGRIERWDSTNEEWEVIGEKITTPYLNGIGTVSAATNTTTNELEIYGDASADFSNIEEGKQF